MSERKDSRRVRFSFSLEIQEILSSVDPAPHSLQSPSVQQNHSLSSQKLGVFGVFLTLDANKEALQIIIFDLNSPQPCFFHLPERSEKLSCIKHWSCCQPAWARVITYNASVKSS